MDFDDRRCDIVKLSIINEDSTQRVISRTIRKNFLMNWSDEDEYLGGESILDIMACDNTNWYYYEDEEENNDSDVISLKVKTKLDEDPLVDLARNHPDAHVRIAAISHIKDNVELSNIIKDDCDKTVKKASLDRLEELFIND